MCCSRTPAAISYTRWNSILERWLVIEIVRIDRLIVRPAATHSSYLFHKFLSVSWHDNHAQTGSILVDAETFYGPSRRLNIASTCWKSVIQLVLRPRSTKPIARESTSVTIEDRPTTDARFDFFSARILIFRWRNINSRRKIFFIHQNWFNLPSNWNYFFLQGCSQTSPPGSFPDAFQAATAITTTDAGLRSNNRIPGPPKKSVSSRNPLRLKAESVFTLKRLLSQTVCTADERRAVMFSLSARCNTTLAICVLLFSNRSHQYQNPLCM